MAGRRTYFVSDVHLGLQVADPQERERRFADFLNGLPDETDAIYLLGDIWDFWYEYRDVVPKGYIRVLSALQALMDKGVKVCFFQGNHDVWTYKYFEELGMIRLEQPALVEIGGKVFCLGHGDGLGPVPFGYRFLRGVFHNRFLQFLFSLLHPWLATAGRAATGCPMTVNMFFVEKMRLFISLLISFPERIRWITSSSDIIILRSRI